MNNLFDELFAFFFFFLFFKLPVSSIVVFSQSCNSKYLLTNFCKQILANRLNSQAVSMNGRDFQLELQSTIAAWRRTASHPCHCSDTEPTYSKERNTGQKLLILQVFMPDMASNIAFRYLGQRYQNQSMQEAIAALERRWAFPPHAGCPYQPVWILNHFRKWVQEYLHAKVKVQIANSLSSHHVSWGLHRESHWCPPDLTNTKYLKTANARLGPISENVGHSSATL